MSAPIRWSRALVALSALGLTALVLVAAVAAPVAIPRGSAISLAATSVAAAASPLQITTFQYSPSTITQGTSTQVSIQLTGGTPPFYAWLNNTPPGCPTQSVPVVTSNYSNNFQCTPTGPGNYNVQLTVLDSSSPAYKASRSATLTVNANSNGNGGSGTNSGNGSGSNGLNLPSGFLSLIMVFAIVLLAALVATAAGSIATAVAVSRRLRQLNETLQKMQPPPSGPKPPT